MASVTRVERQKRGVFGWLFLILFWGFNAFMAYGAIAGLSANSDRIGQMTSEAEQAGAVIGTAIGASFLLMIWVAGAIILGLFVLFTRGKKVIVETTN